MIAPQPVPERALHRLRRRYALTMLALGVPVLVAVFYVLALQYEIVYVGVQRQLAMSTDRRVTQLDAVLGRMREDLLRLRYTAASPGLLTRDVDADRRALAPLGTAGAYSLDTLPPLLYDRSPQVVLFGPRWRDAVRRDAAVERAALFAEQAQLVMLRGGRFSRVSHVDLEAGEVWIYPWVSTSQWVGELGAASVDEAARRAVAGFDRGKAPVVAIEDEVRWRLHEGADGHHQLKVGATMVTEGKPRLVTAEVPLTALEGIRLDAGIGRLWVIDEAGRVVLGYATRDSLPGEAAEPPPTVLAQAGIEAALAAPLAQEVGSALVAARASTVAPWTAVYASDRADVRRRVLRDLWPYIGGGALLMLLFVATTVVIWRQFGQPSLRLVDYLRRQASDAAAGEPELPRLWRPWLNLTRDTFGAWREAAAREQKTEALKSAIVDHALAAVVTTDANGTIVDFNPAAERMFGRTRQEVVGKPAEGLIASNAMRDSSIEDLRRLRRGEAPRLIGQRVETTALRRDGSEFPVDLVLWRSQVGDETFFTASLFDLTERCAAREEIERQRDALRQAEKLAAMGSLLAGVAHELNNPLAIVMGRASLLEDKCSDPALRADAVRIREAAHRCGRIVRTFLAMARQRPATRGPVQLNDLVRGAIDLLQYSLRTGGVAPELQLDPALPAVEADADQLGQVLLNLIVNAQQALVLVDPPRRIAIETGHDDGRVWLRVADNGQGVPPADRTRIFEAFVTTKSEGTGTGLGLAVSRAVALEHGGELLLEETSTLGRGASFRLDLPRQAKRSATVAEAAAGPATGTHAGGRRVLVVDDEPELAAMMRDALEAAGYEVVCAESGAVALAMLDENRFDAVVTDLRMPDIDGRALWHAVRGRDPALAQRFLFVTGDTLSPLAAEFSRESGADCLEKPFAAAELVQGVRRCVADTAQQPAHR